MPTFLRRLSFVLMLAGSVVHAQDFGDLGSRFARTTITQNEKPLLIGAIFEDSDGNLVVKGAPLAELIARAYGLKADRVVDAPEWVYASHQYDIEAVPPPPELVESDEAVMLQSLLAQRFKLRARRETREVTMLVLDVESAKQQELARQRATFEEETGGAFTVPAAGPGVDPAAATAIFRMGVPVLTRTQTIVNSLARSRGEPVHDLTGAEALYLPVTGIRWNGQLYAEPASEAGVLYELSGLILEERSVPLDVLVITGIEHPVLDTAKPGK